jgi:hypothetical protein
MRIVVLPGDGKAIVDILNSDGAVGERQHA